MLLVDTSVWIDFFNDELSACAVFMEKALQSHQPLCINAIIEMEILQGIRDERSFQSTKGYLKSFQYFPVLGKEYYDFSVEIYRECRRKGVTIRRSLDCIIAANCLIDNLSIVHRDRDFDSIKNVYPELDTIKLSGK